MKKLPAKYYTLVFVFLMTLFMGLALSLIFTWREIGFTGGFVKIWLSRFIQTWIIVIPTVAVILPFVKKLAVIFTEKE
jgi:Protein of unknown function (DUF2798)